MFGSQRVHFADGAEMMIFLLTILLSTYVDRAFVENCNGKMKW